MITLKDQKRWKTQIIDGEYVIRGKFGQVALYSDGGLDVWVCTWEPATSDDWPKEAKRSEHRANRMEREDWKAKQHYDDGGLFIRPATDLNQACKYIQASKRRHLNPEQRKLASERLSRFAYSKRSTHVNDVLGPQNPKKASEPQNGGSDASL